MTVIANSELSSCKDTNTPEWSYVVVIGAAPFDANIDGAELTRTVKIVSDRESKSSDGYLQFAERMEIRTGSLSDVIRATHGKFSHMMIEVRTKRVSGQDPHTSVSVKLNDRAIDQRHLMKHYLRNQLFVPLGDLFESDNVLVLTSDVNGKDLVVVDIKLYFCSKDRIYDRLEESCIWVLSAPRSGSTWLANDILCSGGRARPVDEPGLGRILAPLEMKPELFYDLASRVKHFESGLDVEMGKRQRKVPGVAPFKRHFAETARTAPMEHVRHGLHRTAYAKQIRILGLEHVLRVWGVLGTTKAVLKVPAESHAADEFEYIFPKSFFLFLMRDGRDVLKSLFSPFMSKALAATTDPQFRLYGVAYYSHFWNFQVDIIQDAFIRHSEDRRFFVRYEDLRKRPEEFVPKLLRKVGLGVGDEAMAQFLESIKLENFPAEQRGPDKARQEGKVGGYMSVFSEEEINLMNAIMGENLRKYSYQE